MKSSRFFTLVGIASLFLTACVGITPQPSVTAESPVKSSNATLPDEIAPVKKDSSRQESPEIFHPVAPQAFAKDEASTDEPVTQHEPSKPELVSLEIPDIYVEIPRLAQMALTRADSFYAAGNLDSAAAIVEKFSVLNPLWKEWQIQAKSMGEKIRSGYSKKDADLQQFLIALVNANSRRVAFAEVKPIVDTILAAAPSDSIRKLTDSLAQIAYVRSYEKVKAGRDEALQIALEKGAFDSAEQKLSDLIRRYSDFIDTLELPKALLQVSSLRTEESAASAEFWKSHDPNKVLEEARLLSEKQKWQAAKEMLSKLKSSSLRGKALRELDSLNTRYCTEKRKRAAAFFAESKSKKANKADKLSKAIAELDACLEFAPDNKDRATVLSNKQFLQTELAK